MAPTYIYRTFLIQHKDNSSTIWFKILSIWMSKTLPHRISKMELLCAITHYRYCYLMYLMFYSNYSTYNNTGASVPVHAVIFHITCVLVWSFCFVQTTSRMQNSTSSFIFISLMRMCDYMSTMAYLPFVDLSSIWANIVETKFGKINICTVKKNRIHST